MAWVLGVKSIIPAGAVNKLTKTVAKVLIHDVEVRGASMLRLIPQEPESTVQFWRTFFKAITDGTARIWICIVAVCVLQSMQLARR